MTIQLSLREAFHILHHMFSIIMMLQQESVPRETPTL